MPNRFNARELPSPKSEYVCWIDVMGTQSIMARSIKVTANFVFKLHAAAVSCQVSNVKLYPIMDGLYVASPSKQAITDFIKYVFKTLADNFVSENIEHRFLIKGALAYGPVIHGDNVPDVACPVLSQNANYRASILLGLPMVNAFKSENLAPPFGVYIHESARTFSSSGTEPFHHVWLRWFQATSRQSYLDAVIAYFDWCLARPNYIQYAQDRIVVHKAQATEFFQP